MLLTRTPMLTLSRGCPSKETAPGGSGTRFPSYSHVVTAPSWSAALSISRAAAEGSGRPWFRVFVMPAPCPKVYGHSHVRVDASG